MEIAIFWFLFSIATGVWASNKGRNGFGWFLLALIISPLLGLLFCGVSKDLSAKAAAQAAPSTDTHVRCPACAEFVLPQAAVCKHCGKGLTPQPDYAFENAQKHAASESKSMKISLAVLLVLSVIIYFAIAGQ